MKSTRFSSLFVLFGLTISIVSSLFIFDTIIWHKTYDTHIERYNDVFRLSVNTTKEGAVKTYHELPAGLLNGLQNLDGTDLSGRLSAHSSSTHVYNDQQVFAVKNVIHADPALNEMFQWSGLKTLQPSQVVISESLAERVFGKENAVGKVISVNKKKEYEIVAVASPTHSHLKFELILPLAHSSDWQAFKLSSRLDDSYYAFYLRKGPQTSLENLKGQVQHALQAHLDMTELEAVEIKLTPLNQVHLHLGDLDIQTQVVDHNSIRFLSFIGVFALLVALSNYLIYSLAGFRKKLKNYYIRNVLGASRSDFVRAFLRHNATHLGAAFMLSTALYITLAQPFREVITGTTYTSTSWPLLIATGMVLLLFGLLHGLLLGGVAFKTVRSSRISSINSGQGKNTVSQWFTAIQMAVSFSFILFASTTLRQLDYQQHFDLGYKPENVVILNKPLLVKRDSIEQQVKHFKQQMEQLPGVVSLANSTLVPGSNFDFKSFQAHRVDNPGQKVLINAAVIDAEYIDLYNFEMVAGEKLYSHLSKDNTAEHIVINEAAVRQFQLGSPQEAIGKRIVLFRTDKRTVKGVIRDFNQESLKKEIEPVAYFLNPIIGRHFSLKIAEGAVPAKVMGQVEGIWKATFNGAEMNYSYLEDDLKALYSSERLQSRLATIAGLASLIISLIGLIGVLNQLILYKTKALNIKKILGAPQKVLFGFVSKEVAVIFGVASIIAIAIADYASGQWLSSYVYRISVSPWHFGGLMLVMLLIIFSYVSFRVVRLIRKQPVEFLRET